MNWTDEFKLREIVVTADDWGMSPGINRGIVDLARLGVVARVSMMSDAPYLETDLQDLLAVEGLEFGLHFDLTHGPAKHLARSFFASRSETSAELTRQLAGLRRLGIPVSHVDGHQHVHLLPHVISVLRETLRKERIAETRIPFDSRLWFSRRPFLNWLCLYARLMLKDEFSLRSCVYPQPRDFASVAAFTRLLSTTSNAEVIVHPAAFDDFDELGIPDGYRSGRVREFALLKRLAVTPVQSSY